MCDLVAAEAHYHPTCRSNFESLLPKHTSRGRPSSTEKLEAFETVCKFLEDEMELTSLAKFQTMMEKQHSNVYSVKMAQIKLKHKYQDQIKFVSKCGKSNILLPSNINSILSEAWYQDRKPSQDEEVERIIKTAPKLIKIGIKNHEHVTDVYPTTDFIRDKENSSVPSTLKTFIGGLVKVQIKQLSFTQAIFAACRPRAVMPLQFGLAVAVGNHLATKWFNNILHKLGFAVSYDEVSFYECLIDQT